LITVRCWVCSRESAVPPFVEPDPLCSDECRQQFETVVHQLMRGGKVDAEDELLRRAKLEVARIYRTDMIARRDAKEERFRIENPPRRKLPPLYPV
jgi:hypothetical protein